MTQLSFNSRSENLSPEEGMRVHCQISHPAPECIGPRNLLAIRRWKRVCCGTSMKRLVWAALILAALRGQAEIQGIQTNTFVFLNTGVSPKDKGISNEEVGKMQTQHVGNFGAQFSQGKLMAAGPLGGGGKTRGIVVLAVQAPEQIAECFKPDPYVQSGILEVETHPWLVDVMKFSTPKVPFQMGQHTLCIAKKGANWKSWGTELRADSMMGLFPSLKKEVKTGELLISGPFTDGGDQLGVMLFYSTNKAEIQARLDMEASVARGEVQVALVSQYLGKGTFPDPHEDISVPKPGKRRRLFDGKSFAGWEGDTNQMWRVENGALVGGGLKETVAHNDFLCASGEFKNFDLRLKVKLEGTGFVNGGIQLRSQRAKEPAFEMVGYQADMGEGYWGSLYDESRRRKTLAFTHAAILKRIVKTNDWNDYVIRCEGPRVRLWLNGILTVDYTEDEKDIPMSGLIGIQIHGGGKSEASYKDITIEEL